MRSLTSLLASSLSFLAILALGAFTLPAQAAAGKTTQDAASGQAGSVLVSILPQKYFIERIAGNSATVTVLVKPGADPHSYEPSPAQMVAASDASLYFTAGIGLEQAWIPRIAQVAKNLRVVELAAPDDDGEHDHDGHGLHQEAGHTWLSPAHVLEMIPLVTEALCTDFPAQAAIFRANAAKFEQDVRSLDRQIRETLKNIPPDRRSFMTFHPAWKNFAEDYDLREVAIEADGKEPGPRRMAELIELARTANIKIILVEPQFSRKTAEAIAKNISAVLVQADPLAENWADNLSSVAKALAGAL